MIQSSLCIVIIAEGCTMIDKLISEKKKKKRKKYVHYNS